MSLRYVWSTWNVASVTTFSEKRATSYTTLGIPNGATFYEKLTVNSATGAISVSSSITESTYGTIPSYCYYKNGSTYYWVIYDTYDSSTSQYVYKGYKVTAKSTTTYTKGSAQYENVSSNIDSTYPENDYVGERWYVLQGSDTIAPDSVTYEDEVSGGAEITLTITPSTGELYDGQITYLVQTTTDGVNWKDAGITTETTFKVNVPITAVVWNVRVIASDDTGFTSEVPVYGNGVTTYVDVVTVGFVPASGTLGYLMTGDLVIVSATMDKTSESIKIVATLDGEQIVSTTATSGVSCKISITDAEFQALDENSEHTLVVTAEFGSTGIIETRTYTFRTFVYDRTTKTGVWEGLAKATRMLREIDHDILGRDMPYEIANNANELMQLALGLPTTTATVAEVFVGKTFYAGDKILKTGTYDPEWAIKKYW